MKVSNLAPEVWAKAKHMLTPLMGKELPVPTGWHILVAQYVRPERVGSIIIAQKTRDEDVYQGRVGVVLAVGPDAYLDGKRFPGGAWCKPGDWILWPALEQASSRFKYGDVVMATVADDRVLMTGVDPELAVVS